MATEQGLHAQVVKLSRKYLKFIAENKDKNEAKFNFRCLSAISQRWFYLDFDWIEEKFSTHRPDFYNCFKPMTIHKIELHLNYFNFQQEIQNVWNDLSFTMMPQCSSIVRSH